MQPDGTLDDLRLGQVYEAVDGWFDPNPGDGCEGVRKPILQLLSYVFERLLRERRTLLSYVVDFMLELFLALFDSLVDELSQFLCRVRDFARARDV